MVTATRPKRSMAGIELVRLLAYEGDRIFTTDRARELAPRAGLSDDYLLEALHHLRRNDWIVPLRRGLYALSSSVPGVADVNEFEVAMALVKPAAISHWSALNYHGLTEQIPRHVFVLTTTDVSVPRKQTSDGAGGRGGYPVNGMVYRFVQVQPKRYFGTERIWVGDARVSMTDLERTLLDGLAMATALRWFRRSHPCRRRGHGTARPREDRRIRPAAGSRSGQASRMGPGVAWLRGSSTGGVGCDSRQGPSEA